MTFRILLAALIAMFIFSCSSSKKVETVYEKKKDVNWITESTLTDVIVQARKDDKPIFIDFYADWCTPCKMMDRDVYADKSIYQFMNDSFVNFKVNGEKNQGPNLALMFGVQMYPTLLWVDHKGRVIVRKDGAAYHTELKKLSKQALDVFSGS